MATVDANVRRKTTTGALSRITKDSFVTTNFHSNNVQGMVWPTISITSIVKFDITASFDRKHQGYPLALKEP